jgi:hypothetical protein
VGATARLIAHADLNGDGKEDLILAGQTLRMQERGLQILEGNGDGTFRQGITINLQNPTRAMVVADVNGDGKPDLILLHPGVAIFLNTTPSPGAPVSFAPGGGGIGGFGPALAAVDLNGDGKAEVLLGSTPTRDATDNGVVRIGGIGLTGPHNEGVLDIPVPGVPTSIAAADLDGDGKPDIIVGFRAPTPDRNQPGGIAVFLNRTESGSVAFKFSDPILLRFDHTVDFVAAADLNGDGRNDIFAAWCSGRDEPCGAVSLLNKPSPDGGIGFTTSNVSLAVRRASNWILQDINHDGKPDLLFLSRQQGVTVPIQAPGEIVVALGLGDGRFALPRTFSAPTADTLGMALADFNNDGLFDLAILDAASAEAPRISLLLGRKDYGFSAPESLISGFVPTALIPFSDHGKTAGFIATNTPNVGQTAMIFAAKSLDPPYPPLSTVTGIPEGAIAVGDLKGDGRAEMVVVTASDIQIYSLEGKVRSRPVQAAKLPRSSNRFAATPQRAILQDLNGDGKPDLIVGNGYDSSLQIYLNTSAGTFSFAPPLTLPWCPKGFPPVVMKGFVSLSIELASADMNGDGKPDLVASGYCGLNVMLNRTPARGSIAFDQPVPVSDPKQQSPWRSGIFALADVNRDGKADVIVVENNYTTTGETSALDVFVNETTSSPTFRLAQHLPIGKRLTSVAAGDFNRDGWPDIATIDADGKLTFLLNDGQWKSKGAFVVHSSFTVMPNPQQLLVIDRPGGGLPRLVLRNNASAAIVQ